jgi:phage terminase small subunit
MPVLKNPRHEKFAQALFEGKSAHEGYADAGYKPNDGNCIRLKGNERVQARLAELQEAAAKTANVTVESLLAELEETRQKATNLDQLSAAVRAIEVKARVSGLLVQKQQLEISGQIDYDVMTVPEVINGVLHECLDRPEHSQFVTDEDREIAQHLFDEMTSGLKALTKAIAARAMRRGGYSIELQQIANGSGSRRCWRR